MQKVSAHRGIVDAELRAPAHPQYGRGPSQRQARPPRRAPEPTSPAPHRRSRLKIFIAISVLIVAVEAIGLSLGLSKLDLSSEKVLDVSKAQAGVQQILVDPLDGYAELNVTRVVCNDGRDPVIQKGTTFTCEVVVDGRKRNVTAVFQDDNGTYEVDRPR